MMGKICESGEENQFLKNWQPHRHIISLICEKKLFVEPLILPPNPVESALIEPPVIENQPHSESDDDDDHDDETLMPELKYDSKPFLS